MGLLSNYCGFGGSGIPQHKVDQICKEHDADYKLIQDAGQNPYTHFNWADAKMLQKLQEHTATGFKENVLKAASQALWKVKAQVTTPLLNTPPMAKKRPRDISPNKPRKGQRTNDYIPKMRGFTVDAEGDVEVIDDDTNEQTNAPEASKASAAASNSTGQHGYKETSIISQQPHYAVPEVMTITLPWTAYFSFAGGQGPHAAAQDFFIRMTSLSDMIPGTVATPTGGAAVSSGGPFNRIIGGAATWPTPVVPFPADLGSITNENCHWQRYFLKMYQAYTVLNCDWEITFHNPRNRVNADMIVGMVEEAYGTSSGNVAPNNAFLVQAEAWPGVRWTTIHSQTDGAEDKSWKKMQGSYWPGKANKNVRNDEDVKTWTTYTDPTAPSPPSLTEQLHFMVWKAPFNDEFLYQAMNIRVHLRFTVQLRDLNQAYRYPASGITAIAQTVPADIFSLT